MQNVLIIGGSNVVAQEVIKQLPKESNIVAVAIEEDSPRHKQFMSMELPNLHKIILDISKDLDFQWIDELSAEYGDFDAVLYLPSYPSFKGYFDITQEDFDKAVLYHGKIPFLLSHKLIPGMQKLGHGRFVLISSNAAIKGMPRSYDYAITKAMVGQVAKNITSAFMKENITGTALMFGPINIHGGKILPEGITQTVFTEEDRVLSNAEAASFIIRLLNPNNRGFAGTTLMMDTGRDAVLGIC